VKKLLPPLLVAALSILACNYRGLSPPSTPSESAPPSPEQTTPEATLSGPEPEPSATGQSSPDLSDLIQAIDSDLPLALDGYGMPGVAIAIIRDGEVAWVQGYGLADTERGAPVTPETVFQVASLSKTVAAWGVMHLVEEGRLDLDAPAEQYLTRWRLPPSEFDANGVTIGRLLSHTAGLSLHGYPGFPPDAPLPSLEESLSGATNGAGSVYVLQEPGSGHAYSGGGYTLLQLIVEEVTGEPFADYMQREILTPLGMSHSAYVWTPELQPMTATGYDAEGRPEPNFLFTAQAAAGLYSTASDFGSFIAAAMSGPKGEPAGRGILSPQTVALMTSPHPEANGEYGMGYAMETLPDGTHVASHYGGNIGWAAYYALLVDQGEGIVILTNSDNGFSLIEDITGLWADWLANR
jgi:CubicO group peptidase (beta-lactamase class C family)